MLVTWVGPSVSVMKKAKMSTDKALLKDVIQVSEFTNFYRELNVKSKTDIRPKNSIGVIVFYW